MSNRKPVTLHRLRELHAAGEKITMLTCYDAAFARALDEAGVESLLVGDSLGNVVQGRTSTRRGVHRGDGLPHRLRGAG